MIRSMCVFLICICFPSQTSACNDELGNAGPKPPWIAVNAVYQQRNLRLALVLENQIMNLLDNPRNGDQVEPVWIAGKLVPKLVIQNLDTREIQELANRCRTEGFDGTLGLESIPTRFLIIDRQARVAECTEQFDDSELTPFEIQKLVIDDNGFWCSLVEVNGKKFAFQFCSIARMSVSVLRSFPLSIDEVRKSDFLGKSIDPSSAELGPGNAINLILARPEIKKIAIDKKRLEIVYYVEKR